MCLHNLFLTFLWYRLLFYFVQVAVLTAKVSSTQYVTPHGICVMKNNHIAISDVGKHCIYIFDADYELFKQFGKRGSKKSQFKFPYHLATNRNNDILVSDYGNHAVKVFDYKGKFKFKFGSLGSELDQFMHPVGLCTDQDSNIFVCDKDNHRVLMFNNKVMHILSFIWTSSFSDWINAFAKCIARV